MQAGDLQRTGLADQLQREGGAGEPADHLDGRDAAARVFAEHQHVVGAGPLDERVGLLDPHRLQPRAAAGVEFAVGADERLDHGQGVTAGDGLQGRAVPPVLQIGVVRRRDRAPAGGRRENPQDLQAAQRALADQPHRFAHRRGGEALQADRDAAVRAGRRGGHLLRLGEVAAERPFAVDVLAGLQRGQDDRPVLGDLHRDADEIDLGVPRQRQGVAERATGVEDRPGGVRQRLAPRRDRRQLIVGQRRQRRDVSVAGPAALGVGADDSDPDRPAHTALPACVRADATMRMTCVNLAPH